MQIISRKKGEGIVIDDDIIVSVVEIRGDKARLSVECPQETLVHRGEVFAAIHQTTKAEQPR